MTLTETGPAQPPRGRILRRPPLPPRRGPSYVLGSPPSTAVPFGAGVPSDPRMVGAAPRFRHRRTMAAARVLLVTASDGLATPVMRAAALAGADLDLQRASHAVRTAWRSAAVIVVGLDLLRSIADLELPHRRSVLVVGAADPDPVEWRAAVDLGAADVLRFPGDEARLAELIGAAVGDRSGGRVVAVMGGCGGAGASTFAAAVAAAAAQSGPAVLLDADPLGGGLDVMLGAETRPGLRWADLGRSDPIDPGRLVAGLCTVAGVALLSHGRVEPVEVTARATSGVIAAARRAFPQVVIDLPRRLDECGEVCLAAADILAIVVPATVRAVAATAALVARWVPQERSLQLIVRDPGGDRLSARDVAAGLGHPVLTTLRSEPAVAAAALRGEPGRRRGPLADAARALLHVECGAAMSR